MPLWKELALLPEDELAKHPIEAVNLACAEGLPGAEKIDFQACRRTLDAQVKRVRQQTECCRWFEQNPAEYNHSRALFLIHVLVSVLQRDFGVRYNPVCMPADYVFQTEDTFIHGIIQGEGGTCASLPVLYAAVGRRLGYPLKLVRAKQHLFLRWEEPRGERFNIEVSNEGFGAPSDDHFRSGRFEVTPQEERDGCLLKSMTPREELADFLAQRGQRWLERKHYRQAAESFLWAYALEPANLWYRASISTVLRQWSAKLAFSFDIWHLSLPPLRIGAPPPPLASMPANLLHAKNKLEALEAILRLDSRERWEWMASLRRTGMLPPEAPPLIVVRFAEQPGLPRDITVYGPGSTNIPANGGQMEKLGHPYDWQRMCWVDV